MVQQNRNALVYSVRLRKLSVSFGGKEVLNIPQLDIQRGKVTVILGRSGSGKTTFLRSLNRLNEIFPRCKTKGIVHLLFGNRWVDIYGNAFAITELRRLVGMVFQSPNVLPMSIEKNVSLPLKLVLGLPKKKIPERSRQALVDAQLWDEIKDRLNDSAMTLSGGQQQRLCLARVLALGPEILLLDEPTSSLDFKASVEIEKLILNLKQRFTIIAVSHSLTQARNIADQIVVFKEGKIVKILDREDFDKADIFEALIEEIF